MGLFDKLFGRDWSYYLNKSIKFASDDDYGEAMNCLDHAMALANDDDAKSKIQDKKNEYKHVIYSKAFEQAKIYLRNGEHEAAQTAIDRAARHVQNDDERNKLNELIENGNELHKAEINNEQNPLDDDKTELDSDDKWSLYVTSLPFDKAQHYDELGQEFKNAWILLQEEKFEPAIRGLEDVYKKHPDDPYIMTELGRAYYGNRQFDKADALLKKSDDTRDDIETKLLRAELQWAMKKFDVAEQILQAAHDLDPENVSVLARIAQHGLIARDFESGIAAIEVLLEKLPQDVSVQRLAGRIYLESGDDEKALQAFETVNRLYWQVHPQTKKLTFDQTAAATAAALYIKKNENLTRAAELLDAVRANTTGEAHVAVCMQLSEVYEKMNKKSKCNELLTEALRFMDDLIDNAQNAEKALVQLQYAEVAERAGNMTKSNEMLDAAQHFFKSDADKGHPVAAFYVDLIERKKAGEPFPNAQQLQEQMTAFVQKQRANAPMSYAQPIDENVNQQTNDNAPRAQVVSNVSVATAGMAANEDAMHKMAALAAQMRPVKVDASSDSNDSDEKKD